MENKTMMTDFYELTMAQTYFDAGKKDEIAYFDIFFRSNPFNGGYAIMGGLDNIVDYINNFKIEDKDIEYLITKIKDKSIAIWEYVWNDVWSDTRDDWRIKLIKTLNLSIKSFLDSDLQSRAAALTYRTILALVPALAILFAIGRGFGFQNLLQTQLFSYLPVQKDALDTVFGFVDSYLAHSSEGIFVGIGVGLFLVRIT